MWGSIAAEPAGSLNSRPVASHWGRFVALGAVLTAAGILALGDVVVASLVSVILIGAAMFVGGVFQIIHAVVTRRRWGNFLFGLVSGGVYAIGGAFVMREPVQGSVVITLFVLAALVVGGFLRSVIALRHRELSGWWLMLIGGLISVLVGVMLYMALPWSGLWVLGTLIGVELIVQGICWVQFGLALRKSRA
jgi:uncharacterized membrane protein HdeD (DUF308 family)